MKLLFDQNLAPSLVRRLADLYPGSAHVFELGLGEAEDAEVWSFALEGDFVIVSKDSDFHHRSVLEGPPPRVLWLRIGNCTVREMETWLRTAHKAIAAFATSPDAYLVIGRPL